MKYQYIYLSVMLLLVSACTLFEPLDDNHSTFERVYENPEFAEGLLLKAYTLVPTNSYRFDEVATDDAVSNNPSNSYVRMATGEWSAMNNPQNMWANSNRAITYINQLLMVVEDVPWMLSNMEVNDLHIRKLSGEAYALRGLFKYYLLRNHGGFDENGRLMGLQILDSYPMSAEEFSKPRATLQDYMSSIYSDLDKAIELLPAEYGDKGSLLHLPASFQDISNIDVYNKVFGNTARQRMSGIHARVFKARAALLAASPAFNSAGDISLWQEAADYHAELLDEIGGVSGLDPKGHVFYLKEQVDKARLTSSGQGLPEMIWRTPITSSRSSEVNNFPPSLFGNGRTNPSQNLVDAFPMANGYPISHPEAQFNSDYPYLNRDPRLSLYIIYDGSIYKNSTITTALGGGINALDSVENSTRTGYYLKKLLREDVNANPTTATSQEHFNVHIRYTELFLNYAEAANELWGPNYSPHDYTAKDVIAAIRKRAGIQQPDAYLNSITDRAAMRSLIQNERRLELCFEGFRFWDMRRWRKDLTESVKGVRISGGAYSYFTVEERPYDNEYMHYGPLPNSDVIKFSIDQNFGW